MAEWQNWHRKYSLVLFAPFAVVIWRSRSRTVPKSLSRRQCVNYLKKRRITYRETRLNTAVEFMICWKSFLGSHLYGDRCRFPATVVPEDHIVPLLSRWVTWALCCNVFCGQFRFLKNCPQYPPPPPPTQANIITFFSLGPKCWLRGGVGRQFPRNPNCVFCR